jgi:hypothetical protein
VAETFQERACQYLGIPLERYGETVLRLTLYPHARWLVWFGTTEWLAPDRNFVVAVGRLTRGRDFAEVAQDFQSDPRNRMFLRHSLRLRVSVQRMRVLFSEVWGNPVATHARRSLFSHTADDTFTPLTD